ncbi:Putative lumazine-binding [Pedobacter steynii]|uniref:Putative lumazine-binding n=1 Tax=Pedobacter steynii TaxID=430522 RepID=A0A1H0B603_9SPHI|nr:nuclear transport factor 2 family protein [Pedobacter steynii]NQX41147.1 nuclear transport factor 2 family protein [Pedobacter steynii]SDN41085.1 Putative lumazine-binding [Pedobacter steynii]
MRKVFLSIGLSLLLFNVNALVNDTAGGLQRIQKTLDLYIEDQAMGNSVRVGQFFHVSWQLKIFRGNQFRIVPKSQYLPPCKKWNAKPGNCSTSAVFIGISSDIAIAKVEISASIS